MKSNQSFSGLHEWDMETAMGKTSDGDRWVQGSTLRQKGKCKVKYKSKWMQFDLKLGVFKFASAHYKTYQKGYYAKGRNRRRQKCCPIITKKG